MPVSESKLGEQLLQSDPWLGVDPDRLGAGVVQFVDVADADICNKAIADMVLVVAVDLTMDEADTSAAPFVDLAGFQIADQLDHRGIASGEVAPITESTPQHVWHGFSDSRQPLPGPA